MPPAQLLNRRTGLLKDDSLLGASVILLGITPQHCH